MFYITIGFTCRQLDFTPRSVCCSTICLISLQGSLPIDKQIDILRICKRKAGSHTDTDRQINI